MKNGNRIPLTQNVTPITHGSRLVVNSASTATEGEYVCEGSNGVETIQTSSYLHLYGRFFFVCFDVSFMLYLLAVCTCGYLYMCVTLTC